jgi:hypothetical protein
MAGPTTQGTEDLAATDTSPSLMANVPVALASDGRYRTAAAQRSKNSVSVW